jgi:hypothetical protein
VGWAISTARLLLTRLPERAKTRSSPKRALFHCARSGSKGIPRLPNPPLTPQTEYFQLSPFLLTPRDRVAGWADQLLLRALSHPPARARQDALFTQASTFDSLHLTLGEWPRLPFTARIERAHSYRARSASKKGTWLLPSILTASPSRRTPSQSNTAPPHRRMEGPARAACRRRPLNR